MRRPFAPWLLLALILLAVVVVPRLGTAPRAAAQLEQFIFLPLGAERVRMADLPVPPWEPVVTDTPEPIPTDTVEVPPSQTPEPTETDVPEGGGTVTGRLLLKGAPVPEAMGGSYPGPGLFLRKCASSDRNCEVVSRVGVDAQGLYTFTYPASLVGGEFLQVLWWNEFGMLGTHEVSGFDDYLGAWYGPKITRLDAGEEAAMPDFELANVDLLAPTKGTGFQGFPISFAWSRYAGPLQTYKWSICKCCQSLDQRPAAYQKNNGTQTTYDLDSQPPGTRIDPNERYCWFIQMDSTGNRGYGQTFEARMMWFFLEALAPLGLVDTEAWTGR
jgi:hypothetical protein